jgi:serine protease Do
MGDSEVLEVGDGAIAIGNALGYGQSVTAGVISAVNREVQLTDGTVTLVQTDAAINPGNSGGALLNTRGEVIGVNTIKYADTDVEGMGFAIPINSALETAQGIIDGSIVPKTDENTAYLGISGGTLDEATAESYGYPQGVYISMVERNSAAARAGLQQGDIITGFNGEEILTMEELQERLMKCMPGDQVTLTVQRQNMRGNFSEMELSTILGSRAEMIQ